MEVVEIVNLVVSCLVGLAVGAALRVFVVAVGERVAVVGPSEVVAGIVLMGRRRLGKRVDLAEQDRRHLEAVVLVGMVGAPDRSQGRGRGGECRVLRLWQGLQVGRLRHQDIEIPH